MGLVIHHEKIDREIAAKLCVLCPFGAIRYENEKLEITSGCKMCKLCAKKGPEGAITWHDDTFAAYDKSEWRGVTVFAQQQEGRIHPVSFELLGKAKELAAVIDHPVYALLIGKDLDNAAQELLRYGADKVYVYDEPELKDFVITPYANAFSDFIEKVKPSSILVGATVLGRSLAPKVAARVHAGLTADCTILEMKENTDLVQIRPAFGGNIMAQIVSPNTRPQFCTVRYKVFSAPAPCEPKGEVVRMTLPADALLSNTEVLEVVKKPEETDISDADVIVAVGRGLRSKDDLKLAKELAELLGAQLACTRPLVEAGWLDAKQQIGLSGRTVKPSLIITLGISGAIQFASGMNKSDVIVAVNSDPNASIFDVAHYGFVGDLYEVVPQLITYAKESRDV